MLSVHTILRWVGAGVSIALLPGIADSAAIAGGHRGTHRTTVSQVTYVPVSTGVQSFAVQAPQMSTSFVAPLQMHFVQTQLQYVAPMQVQMVAPNIQAAPPNLTYYVPQMASVPPNAGSLQGSPQAVLSESQLLFQQSLTAQLESSGWLKGLKDKLIQRMRDLTVFSGGNLPAKDAIVKFLLDEATAFLKNTPFGPFMTILQPVIEKLVDSVIKEQMPLAPVLPLIPSTIPSSPTVPITPGATGSVKRYIISFQEIDANGANVPPTTPTVTPQPPVNSRQITPDAESPLEKPAVAPKS